MLLRFELVSPFYSIRMENYIENYTHQRDVLVHKKKTHVHVTIFMLPLFLVIFVGLFGIVNSRNLFPRTNSQNPYTFGLESYMSPLSSSIQ